MSAPPTTKTASSARCILVVEDDTAVREMVVRALQGSYQMFGAKDGMEASEVLPQMPSVPSLVICDVMMPRVDGFSFVRLMQTFAELKSVPILFLSAKARPQDVVLGIQLGARHYMTKPFKVHELVDLVGRLVK